MRTATFLIISLLTAAALAGCSGDSDDSDDVGATPSPTATGSGPSPSPTNDTAEPNELPELDLEVTDEGGNVSTSTVVGGSLTFDASGSTDPDGEITDLAIIVQDANQTRHANLLRDGQQTTATFSFDRPGVVQVTLNALDDSGGSVSLRSEVYINHPQTTESFTFSMAAPPTFSPDSCSGPSGEGVVDAYMWKAQDFDVLAGAKWVEVTLVVDHELDAGDASFAVCDPDGNAISDVGEAGETLITSPDANFTASLNYFVSVASGAPQSKAHAVLTVHYDPLPDAPAEE